MSEKLRAMKLSKKMTHLGTPNIHLNMEIIQKSNFYLI